jgi:regulator of protease activity HflC (stomatin/prohibitin superfamily)
MTKKTLRFLMLLAMPFSGCTCHSTDSTQVGVVTRRVGFLGKQGISEETYPPGATYSFPMGITDWTVYDVALQNLEMTHNAKRGDRAAADDIEFKTIDGNDIRVDVTVAWQIDPKMAPHLLAKVGNNLQEVKEKLVRPTCRTMVRDVLNTLKSEEFYISDKRFAAATEAQAQLNTVLNPEGILIRQVIFGEHHFHPQYETVIKEKKLAEQNTERMHSEAKAAEAQAKSDLERAKGTVQQQLAQAQGQLDTVKLQANAAFFQNQQRAAAIVIEKKAHAISVQKENEALASTGGKTLVKLKIADALQGKPILFVPGGGKSGAGLSTVNINQLVSTYAGATAAQQAPPAAGP